MNIDEIDTRMIQLYHELVKRGVLKYKRSFCLACGLPEQNFNNIAKYKVNHFSLIHVANVCSFYGINANWIIDENETELFRTKKQNSTQTVHKHAQNCQISET